MCRIASSLAALVAICAGAQAASRPNILFLLADDMGYGDLGCYGNPVIKTPNLDRLASQGVRLTHCYSASSNCSPSRTGILTGRTPYRVGMYDFISTGSPMYIPRSEIGVATLLGQAGYRTMFAGKWHCSGILGNDRYPDPGDVGFRHWFANQGNFGHNPEGFIRNGNKLARQRGWMSEVVVGEAMEWLDNGWDRDGPFCAFLWFSEPHTPVVAADRFLEMYDNEEAGAAAKLLKFGGPGVVRNRAKESEKQRYFGCVTMLDHHIGRLLKKLDQMGVADDTLVIFTSDNGPEHRTDTAFGSPGSLRGAKGHMHEGGIRVPGIIRWPGKIRPGTASSVPVNGTDYLPTLSAAAGAKVPEDRVIDGVNIMPAIIDGRPLQRPRPMMWWLSHARGGKEVVMRSGDRKILAHMTPQLNPGAIEDAQPPAGVTRMEFIKRSRLGGFAMYDLVRDPAETTDLAGSQPDDLTAMRERFVELFTEVQKEGPTWSSIKPVEKAETR